MRVVIFGSPALGGLPFLAEGLQKLGCSVTWREDRAAYKPKYAEPDLFDCAVTDGIREPMKTMCEEYTALGLPVLVMDLGYLNRWDGYHQLGLNRLNWMPEEECPSDRFYRLGIDLKPQSGGDYILITGQKPYDGQHHMGPEELVAMYSDWVREIRQRTDREIVFRPHPKGYDLKVPGVTLGLPTNLTSGGLDEAIAGAHCVVTYNSTSATDALIAGKPVFCHESAQASSLANSDLSNIERPRFPSDQERQQHFNRVAYSQWLAQELESGEAAQFILEAINADPDLCRKWQPSTGAGGKAA